MPRDIPFNPPQLADAFTGELFTPRSRNHYEVNDGVPVAPKVELRRPTVRERVENLLNRGVDPLAYYVGTEGYDLEVPDDPEAPLTDSELNYLDTVAAEVAEAAPLPDEGIPRPSDSPPLQPAPAAPEPGVASPPAGGLPPPTKS